MDYEIVLSAIQIQLGISDTVKKSAISLYNQYLAKSKVDKVLIQLELTEEPITMRMLRCLPTNLMQYPHFH